MTTLRAHKSAGRRLLTNMAKHWQLYVLLLPAVVTVIIFRYVPIYGVQLAFKSMKLGQSIAQARWVGWKNFERFFSSGWFTRTTLNTLRLGLISQLTFPLPILLALLLHNCVLRPAKRFTQAITYIPNLISTVVTMSIVAMFCGNSTGFINIFLNNIGAERVMFYSKEAYVLPMYLISGIWQGTGAGAVIYLASLAAIDPELIDASMIDGCSKLKRIWYIELPTIRPTIVILLIMSLGGFFGASTEKLLLLQTDLNIAASESIGTYTYKVGMINRQYGYSVAVDLFTTVVNFIMLLTANLIARKVSDTSLF